MANVLVVLFSSNDLSRNFPALVPASAGATFYNVASDDLSTYLGGPWSTLPSVCLTLNVSGAPSPTMCGLLADPPDWATVQSAINVSDNTSLLEAIVAWGSYSAGSPISGPLTGLFNQGVVVVPNGLNPIAQQMIPLITPILADPTLGPQYWANLLANPPAWLDAFAISYVENLSQLYAIPLI